MIGTPSKRTTKLAVNENAPFGIFWSLCFLVLAHSSPSAAHTHRFLIAFPREEDFFYKDLNFQPSRACGAKRTVRRMRGTTDCANSYH